jgi:hypothetical protein
VTVFSRSGEKGVQALYHPFLDAALDGTGCYWRYGEIESQAHLMAINKERCSGQALVKEGLGRHDGIAETYLRWDEVAYLEAAKETKNVGSKILDDELKLLRTSILAMQRNSSLKAIPVILINGKSQELQLHRLFCLF